MEDASDLLTKPVLSPQAFVSHFPTLLLDHDHELGHRPKYHEAVGGDSATANASWKVGCGYRCSHVPKKDLPSNYKALHILSFGATNFKLRSLVAAGQVD